MKEEDRLLCSFLPPFLRLALVAVARDALLGEIWSLFPCGNFASVWKGDDPFR